MPVRINAVTGIHETSDDTGQTMTELELLLQRVLAEHVKVDIGSCRCGWGVNTGAIGRAHATHILTELRKVGLDVVKRS